MPPGFVFSEQWRFTSTSFPQLLTNDSIKIHTTEIHTTRSKVIPHLSDPRIYVNMIKGSMHVLRWLQQLHNLVPPDTWGKRFDPVKFMIKFQSFSNQSDSVTFSISIQVD